MKTNQSLDIDNLSGGNLSSSDCVSISPEVMKELEKMAISLFDVLKSPSLVKHN